jgi:hypothetical protein
MKLTATLNMSLLLALAACANAQDEGKTCTNETLKGSYGGSLSGTHPAPFVMPGGSGFPGQMEEGNGVALWVFDGKGNFTQVFNMKGSVSGWIPDVPMAGTYTVRPDCTAVILPFPGPGLPQAIIRAVIVDGGKEFRTVTVFPPSTNVVGSARKMN